MVFTEKYISQITPTGTSPVTFVTDTTDNTIVKLIYICNLQTGTTNYFSIYYNPSMGFGDDYVTHNAIHYQQYVANNDTLYLNTYLVMGSSAGLGVQCHTSTGERLTFTAFGADL